MSFGNAMTTHDAMTKLKKFSCTLFISRSNHIFMRVPVWNFVCVEQRNNINTRRRNGDLISKAPTAGSGSMTRRDRDRYATFCTGATPLNVHLTHTPVSRRGGHQVSRVYDIPFKFFFVGDPFCFTRNTSLQDGTSLSFFFRQLFYFRPKSRGTGRRSKRLRNIHRKVGRNMSRNEAKKMNNN